MGELDIIMECKTSSYPQFSACGLNCGLCPRYYTVGSSMCPGCMGEGFSGVHPSCGVLSCCQRKGFERCFECSEFPCKKYENADKTDSFITHKNQFRDIEKARRDFNAYKAELNVKIQILQELLTGFDDGRHKSFYCLAINLLELKDIHLIRGYIGNHVDLQATLQEKAKTLAILFQAMADEKEIVLKLRKQA